MKEHSAVKDEPNRVATVESLVARNETEKDHWKQTPLIGMSDAPRKEILILCW